MAAWRPCRSEPEFGRFYFFRVFLLGAMRASAQLVSYEIPMGMSILGVVLLARSLNLEWIIDAQADRTWFVFCQPIGFLPYGSFNAL